MELDPEGFLVQTLVAALEELFEFEEGELEGQGKIRVHLRFTNPDGYLSLILSLNSVQSLPSHRS